MTFPGFFEGTGMPDPGWWEALWPDPRGVLLKAGVKPEMDVVDLCSGDGWFTLQIANMARSVTAIEIDPKLLETARVRLNEAGARNCTYIEGDAYEISSLLPTAVDHVFMANAFHGVPEKSRLAAAVRTALKRSGLFAVVNWYARPREETPVLGEPRGPATELRIDPAPTIAAVEAGGLAHVYTMDVSPYHYAAVFERH
jgi:predicted methyltransferase